MARLWRWLLALVLGGAALAPGSAFNLDAERPAVFSGPEGSYFGFAVDFFAPDPSSIFLLVGAPKANTTQHNIVEGGQVLKCNWNSNRNCQPIIFDSTGQAPWGNLRSQDDIFFKALISINNIGKSFPLQDALHFTLKLPKFTDYRSRGMF